MAPPLLTRLSLLQLGHQLGLKPASSLCFARRSSTHSPHSRYASKHAYNRGGNSNSKRAPTVRRYVPEDIKPFFRDGVLLTNSDNVAFFNRLQLDPDNGSMTRFTPTPAVRRAASEFNVTLAYSPRHILHPHDLRYFDPRGHPLTAMVKDRYESRVRDAPFWILSTVAGAASAVVRATAQRRLKVAIFKALRDLGYGWGGCGQDREIRGTLWVTVHDPVRAANLPAERLGAVVAEALDAQCSRSRERM